MRLREPVIHDWLGYTIAVPMVVVASPIFIAVALIIGLIWLKRQALGPHREWAKWFAWYPVNTGRDGTRWLEYVERRTWGVMADIQYRALEGKTDGTE